MRYSHPRWGRPNGVLTIDSENFNRSSPIFRYHKFSIAGDNRHNTIQTFAIDHYAEEAPHSPPSGHTWPCNRGTFQPKEKQPKDPQGVPQSKTTVPLQHQEEEQQNEPGHNKTNTSSPKGNDRSPESNVPRSNLISKNSNSFKL